MAHLIHFLEREAARGHKGIGPGAPRAPHQDSWPETFINPKDGSTLRLIPGGEFTMGSTPRDIESAARMDADGPSFDLTSETPQFQLFVPTFYMGVFTVTNEQFARFLSELQPGPALFDLWVYSSAHIIRPGGAGSSPPAATAGERHARSDAPYLVDPGFERHPAVHITWFGAEAYCRWAGLRLPTEIEWEKAARGTDARLFPWGNEWHDEFLRWNRGHRVAAEPTAEVDEYAEGRSPYGIFQMAGNVAEWCEDWYQPRAYDEHGLGNRRSPPTGNERVLRGGSCVQWHRLKFRCAMRQASTPAFTNLDYTGFRCACDLPGRTLGTDL